MVTLLKNRKRKKKSTDKGDVAGGMKGTDEEDQDHEETMSDEFCFIFCLISHGKKFANEFSS